MRSTPRRFHTEEQLYASAVRALSRRSHSVHEMRIYLERRAQDKDIVPGVMKRLKDHGYLDDARYAKQFARARAQNRRQGGYRITRDLRARGIPDRHIEGAVEAAFAETDETTLARQRIERKLRSIRGPLDQKKLASLYRNLLRAGFSSDIIRRELRAASKQAAELPDPALPDEF
jgi:regulatory protein